MPCYKIRFKHSAMRPDYVGLAIKYAHDKDEALKCLGRVDKKNGIVIDKQSNTLTIISINEES